MDDRLWCRNQGVGGFRPFPQGSGDAAGHRHAEAGHDVDDLAGDLGLGLLCRQTPGVEAATDQFFVPEHRHLRQRALSVIDRPLPAKPTALPDQLDVAVALGRGGFGRGARHRGRAGRNDHRGIGRVPSDGAVNWLSIICAISKYCGNRAVDLVEQRADQRRIAVVRGGQFRGEDLTAVGIDRQVELAPAPARLAAVLLVPPLPNTFNPVLSITTWTFAFFRAVATPRSTLRRENVVW
jgi:hypothetical protein